MSADIIYYNITIGNNDPTNANQAGVGTLADISANNNIPIVDNPDLYYCSIIRFSIPCFNVPLIQFLIQVDAVLGVTDINLGIYGFTVGKGSTYGNQCFVNYKPQITLPSYQIPKTGTKTQSFGLYYYLYDYTWFIDMLNDAIDKATISYNTISGDTAPSPYFIYDASTQLITLYTDAKFNQVFGSLNDNTNSCILYFNNSLRNFFTGLCYVNTGEANPPQIGLDDYVVIRDFNGTNITPTTNLTKTIYQYNAYGYWSFLKSIIISTNMNVNSEIFYINNTTSTQNVNYINVLTDYIPDFAQQNGAGLSSQILSYSAPSLYRMFSFNQKNPLYNVSLTVNLVDNYNNLYPLPLDFGQQCSFKLMFIKKSVYTGQNMFRH